VYQYIDILVKEVNSNSDLMSKFSHVSQASKWPMASQLPLAAGKQMIQIPELVCRKFAFAAICRLLEHTPTESEACR